MRFALASMFCVSLFLIAGCPQANRAPVANAGDDQAAPVGSTVILSGANSVDPDNDDLDFLWVQLSGTPVTLSNSTTATASFVAPLIPDVLIFRLTVDDDQASNTDQVSVNVTLP